MRYAIIADIHSNLEALTAVLEDIKNQGNVAEIWCLGDIVGYGPNPRECLELLRQHKHICVAGNHDWAAISKISTADFNPLAAAAAQWTAQQLEAEDFAYLENLPLTLRQGEFTIVHGSPREPIWEYLLSVDSAQANFSKFDTRFCLVGHSHIPLVFTSSAQTEGCSLNELREKLPLRTKKQRLIINPGGVGQPRDGDPRASYAIYDSKAGALHHYRIPYNIPFTQQKMKERGLPERLATRLSYGR